MTHNTTNLKKGQEVKVIDVRNCVNKRPAIIRKVESLYSVTVKYTDGQYPKTSKFVHVNWISE